MWIVYMKNKILFEILLILLDQHDIAKQDS